MFCSSPTVTLDQQQLHSQCLLMLLRKENALLHSAALPAGLILYSMPKLKNPITKIIYFFI